MKKSITIAISLILVFCITGCGLIPSVELTEGEQKVIAEYAAGLLLKHDRNYSGAITPIVEEEDDLDIIPEATKEEPVIAEELPENEAQYNDPEFSEDLTAEENAPADSVQYSDIPIAAAIGLDGFDIIYKTYECTNIYPTADTKDMVFALEAAPGMELLVLTFGITNNNADRSKCDVLNSDAGFRLLINGSEKIQAQKTMLLNDLGTFSDDVEGYGVSEAVLVFEIAEGTSSNISSLDLIVKNGDVNTTHRLR